MNKWIPSMHQVYETSKRKNNAISNLKVYQIIYFVDLTFKTNPPYLKQQYYLMNLLLDIKKEVEVASAVIVI
ncbi:17128_t:CDS:2 [Entrophospora sp. SA101]|nr:17128_t:CDS:2 [Entrophospora sp. SA101]